MNIAVLSGKGGTGKTTISTNMALAINANYIDCDVEEPNGFIFLKPDINERREVSVDYPDINSDKCNACGACVETCNFNALAKVDTEAMVFEKLCHGCGACQIICKQDAIKYRQRKIGFIETGKTEYINCMRGVLNITEPMAVPIIKNILSKLPKTTNLIDCSPGTSCNVVNTLKYADGAILVTEPTAFGLHDLKMAVELVKMFKIPFGIIINKDFGHPNIINEYCIENGVDIIGSVHYDRDVAKIYSRGDILYNESKYKSIFDTLAKRTKEVLMWN